MLLRVDYLKTTGVMGYRIDLDRSSTRSQGLHPPKFAGRNDIRTMINARR
jgi:hypothetical protein